MKAFYLLDDSVRFVLLNALAYNINALDYCQTISELRITVI